MRKTSQHKKRKNVDQKELMHTYELLKDLMRHIPDVIYFKDPAGRLVMVNDAHAKGLGLSPDEVVGKTDFDIFPKARAELMYKDDCYVMQTGKPIIDKIERSTRADGGDNYVSTTKVPRYDAQGRIVGLIGITRDITRRMQLERLQDEKELIEKKLQALEELNRIKSEFISVVSHELRTPLAIIKEAVLLLVDEVTGTINEKQKEVLFKARNNIERLKRIIDDLLEVSRIEAGRLKLHYSLINLNELVEEVIESFQKPAQEKGITLKGVSLNHPVYIFVDAHRMHQVLSNLLGNAVKFTEEDGTIDVKMRVFPDKVRVGVIDTGVGIAKEDVGKLFTKFTQVSQSADNQRKGLGLGLSIAKELVVSHGGEIWVESNLGQGSKFYFTLPYLCGMDMLSPNVKKKVNTLLAKSTAVYFVSFSIIQYSRAFTQAFSKMGTLMQAAAKRYYAHSKEKPEVVSLDIRQGRCSFIFPSIPQENLKSLMKEFSQKIKKFFIRKGLKDIFINTGLLLHPEGIAQEEKEPVGANLKIERVWVGKEARRFERVKYRLSIELCLPEDKRIASETIDISAGGISFYSAEALKADAKARISLTLAGSQKNLLLEGQVCWVGESFQDNQPRYKIGLRFSGLDTAKKKLLSEFIHTLKTK